METVKDKIERLRGKADVFLKNDIKAFIINTKGDWFFCDILMVGEDFLFIKNFAGKRKGKKDRLIWFDIEELVEYEERQNANSK